MDNFGEFQIPLSDRVFDEEKMYDYVQRYAAENHLEQTSKVLPYARELHKHQYRKGKEHIPYIYHPLLVCCHALSLGIADDNLLSASLLHDVCEDCQIKHEDLPVNETTRAAVVLLTKKFNHLEKTEEAMEEYYVGISQNEIAIIVKLLDRCSNISGMSAGFSREKMIDYINDTEKWVYPLFGIVRKHYPHYASQAFCIKYHMASVIGTMKHQFHI